MNTTTSETTQTTTTTATPVPDAQRMSFLPNLFGTRYMMRGEALVYAWMGRLCKQYAGGYWLFYAVPTIDAEGASTNAGSGYMAPKTDERMRLMVDGNGLDGDMSADAAGVVATLFALCQIANATEDDTLTQRHHDLRDYAAEHPEAALIYRVID
jgi:hypothetical protein